MRMRQTVDARNSSRVISKSRLRRAALLALAASPVAMIFGSRSAHAAQVTDTWTGADGGLNWMDFTAGPPITSNWTTTNVSGLPSAFDSLVFAGTVGLTNTNNYTAGTDFDGITFNTTAGAFTLTGNSITLSGQGAGVTLGLLNQSTNTETVNNNLSLDWGFYTFSNSTASGTLSVNGTLTPNTGGVAYFGATGAINGGSSLSTLDSSGLIASLGGAGLMENAGGTFTGLATYSGGQVTAYTYAASNVYTAAQTITGAASAATAQNIEITSTSAANYTFAGTGANINYFNTILVTNASGNKVGLSSTSGAITVNVGSVTGIGGIYLNSNVSSQELTIGDGASNTFTAGTLNTGGEFILGIDGTSTSNQMELNGTIANNGTGPVSVVRIGTGSNYMNVGQAFTGGFYVDQGYVQVNVGGGTSTTDGLGLGTVYVASDATVYFNASSGTWQNNFVISQGIGAPLNNHPGVLDFGNGATVQTISGTLDLLGNPVTATPGDQIVDQASGGEALFTGKIFGTGTLEFKTDGATEYFVLQNTNATTTNTFTGGLLVDSASTSDSAYVKLGANNQLQGNNVILTQPGSAGVVRLDLNGFNDTVGSLSSSGTTSADAQIQDNISGTAAIHNTLTIGANNATGGTFAGVISNGTLNGVIALTKTGTGTQVLSGANTFSGGLTINGGAIDSTSTAAASALGVGNVAVNSSGALIGGAANAFGFNNFGDTNDVSPDTISINGTGIVTDSSGAFTITLPDINMNGGTLTNNAGNTGGTGGQYSLLQGTVEANSSAGTTTSLISAGIISLQDGNSASGVVTFTVGGTGSASNSVPGVDLLVTSKIENFGTNTDGLIKAGTGTMDLDNQAASNTYTGTTAINAGTLQLGLSTDTSSLASPLGTGAVNVGSALVFASSQNVTVSNAIGGTGTLSVTNGTASLSGASSFTGNTTVGNASGNAALVVTGQLTASSITINTGGILSGAGNGSTTGLVGNINLNSGGNINPGSSPADGSTGLLTAANLNVAGGNMRVDVLTGSNDELSVTGTANYTGASTISISSLSSAAAGTYILVQDNNGITFNGVEASSNSQTDEPTLTATVINRSTYALNFTNSADQIQLIILQGPATLYWNGTTTAWDVQGSQNWLNTGNSAQDYFYNQDNVNFDNVNNTNGNYTVNIAAGGVAPGSVNMNSGVYTFTGAGITGITGLNVNGGTLILQNTNTYTGATNVSGGELVVGTGAGGSVASAVNITNGAEVSLGTGGNIVGAVNVVNGTLQTAGSASFSSVTLGAAATNGVLDVDGSNATVASLLAGGAGATVGNSNTSTVGTLTFAGGSSTFSGVIEDTLPGGSSMTALAVSSGTLTLTGTNTYSGGTNLNGGELSVVNLNNLSPTSAINFNGGELLWNATSAQTFNSAVTVGAGGGTLSIPGQNLTLTSSVSSTTGSTFRLAAGSGTLTYTGNLSGFLGGMNVGTSVVFDLPANTTLPGAFVGSGGITQNGPGTLIFNGDNTYSGPTIIAAGEALQIGAGTNATANLGNGTVVTLPATSTLSFDLNGNAAAYNDSINTTNGFGAGTMNLLGGGVNWSGSLAGFTGTLNISAGARLESSAATAVPTSAAVITIASGGAYFEATAAPATAITSNITLAGVGYTGDGVNANYGALRLETGNTTFSGTITLAGANNEIELDNPTVTFTGSVLDGDSGNANLELTSRASASTARLILNGSNSWGGGTNIEAATIQLGSNSALPSTGALALGTPASGAYGGTVVGDAVLANAVGTLDLHGFNATITGLASEGTRTSLITNAGAGVSTLTFAGANGVTDTTGDGSGGDVLINTGIALTVSSGTLNLTAANTYTGATNVNGGLLQVSGSIADTTVSVGTAGALAVNTGGLIAATTNLTVNGAATFNNAAQMIATLNGSNTGSIALNGTGLTVSGGGSFAGPIANGASSGSLTISGGTLTLSGINTYSGATNVNAGVLSLEGSQLYSGVASPGTATIAGGTLAGGTTLATINSNVSMTSGVLAPDAAGTLDITGSLTMSGGTLLFSGTTGGISLINVGSTANLNAGGLSFSTVFGNNPHPGTYTILTSNTLNNSLSLASQFSGGDSFQPFISGQSLDVAVTLAPFLTWTGQNNTSGTGTWDLANTTNWFNTTSSTPNQVFTTNAVVTFDNSATAFNVNLDGSFGPVQPSAVTFNNTSADSYVFTSNNGTGISGSGPVIIQGGGTVTFDTANTYTGLTTVSNGSELILGNGGSLVSNVTVSNGTVQTQASTSMGALTLGNGTHTGTLDLDGQSTTVGGLSGTTGVVGNSSGSPATLNYAGATSTFAGVIQDTLPGGTSNTSLNITSGTLLLAGANTFSGQTSINSGTTLQVGNGTAGSVANGNTFNNSGTLIFNTPTNISVGPLNNGGALEQMGHSTLTLASSTSYSTLLIGGGATLQVDVGSTNAGLPSGAVTDNGTLVLDRSDSPNFSSVISGTGSLVAIGTGDPELSGSNSYSGGTIIESGAELDVNNNNSLGTGSVTIQGASGGLGGTLDLSGDAAAGLTFGTRQVFIDGFGVATGAYPAGEGAIVDNSPGVAQDASPGPFVNLTLEGNSSIGGTVRWDIRSGPGTIDLNGFTLDKVGTNQISIVAITINNGAATTPGFIDIAGGGQLGFETSTTTVGSGTIQMEVNSLADCYEETGGLTWTVNMLGNNTFGNGGGTVAVVNSPIVVQGSGATFEPLSSEVPTPTANDPLTLNGNISSTGAYGLTFFGATTWTLTGTNTWTGGTNLEEGTLVLGSGAALPSGTILTMGASSASGPSAGNQGAAASNTAAILDLDGHSFTIDGLSVSGTGAQVIGSSSTTAASVATLTYAGGGNPTSIFTGVIKDSVNGGVGKVALTVTGGSLVLNGANTYSGGTNLNGGEVDLSGAATTLGTGPIAFNSGTLQYSTNSFDASAPGITINAGGGTIDTNGNAVTFAHSVGGVGGLSVVDSVGTGTLTLSAANSYAGGTNISDVGVVVTGSLSTSGLVTVNSGGILSGAGNGTSTGLVGSVALNSGGDIRPGSSVLDGNVGKLYVNNLSVTGGDMRFDLANSANDEVMVSGSAAYNGPSTITITPASVAASPNTYTVVDDTSGPITYGGGDQPTLSSSNNGRASYTLSYANANEIQVIVTGSPANLTWTAANSNTWDVQNPPSSTGTFNWNNNGSADQFYSYDNVTFDNTSNTSSVTPGLVTISNGGNGVEPSSVTMNNTSALTYTFNGEAITGTTGLNLIGGGTLVLENQNNTFTGNTTISNNSELVINGSSLASNVIVTKGTLQTESSTSLGTVTLGNGTNTGNLDLDGQYTTVAEVTAPGATPTGVIGNSSGNQATLNYAGATSTFAGVIQDTLPGGSSNTALNISSGTLVLTGANTYSGQTNINNGTTLQIGNGTVGSVANGNTFNNSGTLIFDTPTNISVGPLNGGAAVQQLGASTLTLASTTSYNTLLIGTGATVQIDTGGTNATLPSTSLTDNGTLVLDRGDNPNFSSVIAGSGSVVDIAQYVAGTGQGEPELTGSNTYSGGTVIAAGAALEINNNSALGTGSVTIQGVSGGLGGTLDLSGDAAAGLTLGAKQFFISGNGVATTAYPTGEGAIVNNTPGVGQDASPGPIENLTLEGNSSIGGTARWDIRNSGTLNLNGYALTKIGTNQIAIQGITITNGTATTPGFIDIQSGGELGFETTTSTPGNASAGSINVEMNALMDVYEETGGLTWTINMLGNNTFGNSGGTAANVPAPIVIENTGVTFEPINTINPNPADNYTLNLSGNISSTGAYGLTIFGGNTVTLSGTNTWTGGTNLDGGPTAGTLVLGSNAALPTGTILTMGAASATGTSVGNTGPTETNTIAILDLGGFNATIGGLATSGGGMQTIGSSSTTAGLVSTLTYAGASNPASIFPGAGAGIIQDSVNGGVGKVALNVTSGSLTLNGSNNYSGGTSVGSAGSLTIALSTALPGANTAVTNNGAFNITATDNAMSISSITGTGATSVGSGSTATIAAINQGSLANGGVVSLTGGGSIGQITGAGNLTIGNGTTSSTLALTGVNFVSTQTMLTINGGATTGSSLNLGQNAMLISDGGSPATAEAYIQQLVENGQGGPTAMAGGGNILSSYAALNGLDVAYADAGDTNMTGSKLATDNPGDIVIEPALAGDTDLNGSVNIHDLTNLLSNFNGPGFWDQGNFNGHANVDISDLSALLTNFNTSVGLTYSEMNGIENLVGQWGYDAIPNSNGIGFTLVSVPEPASVGLIAVAGVGLLTRRRRRN
jgi:fibronectin-binding autotransporter adhesin